MTLQDIQTRINELFQRAEAVLRGGHRDSSDIHWLDPGQKAEVRTAVLSFLERVFGNESAYYVDFKAQTRSQLGSHFESAVGTLRAAKEEIEGRWMFTTKGIISAEIFADYLEMADHLLSEGYKDPAAVIVGSTLEEHLRQLCQRASLPVEVNKNGKMVPLKADKLNADLAKANVYGKLDQKNVTAWLGLRNKAAHGKYQEYTKDQVQLMVQSVRDFISRVPV